MAVKREDPPVETPAPVGGAEQDERIEKLERENAELRRMLAQAQGMGTIRLETSAAPERRRVLVSEGVRADLERLGEVTDPGTGLLLRRDESGTVTAHERGTGEPADVEIVGA